jgi:hypothetical protein
MRRRRLALLERRKAMVEEVLKQTDAEVLPD